MSALYEASTTTTAVRGTHSGTFTSGTFTGTATTTTRLRSRLAPPPRPFPWHLLTGAAGGFVALVMVCSGGLVANADDLTNTPVAGLAMLFVIFLALLIGSVVGTVMLSDAHRKQLPAWRPKRAAWERRYYCSRCDGQFTPRASLQR